MKSPTPSSSTKRIITIGGGKGGVGKSIVSSNLAVAMAQNGSRVVLVDCDLGAANQHVLFGIDRPVAGLQALIDRSIDSLEDARSPTALPNLHLVAGTGAAVGAANITHGEKQRVMKKIQALDADVIIVDVGAGVSYNVLDFFELGSQRLLVVTPQVTSIQTTYSFLKGAVLRTLRHSVEKNSEVDLLEPAVASKENEKVSRLLARLRTEDPVFAEAVFRILNRFGAQIVGNQVSEPNQTGIFHAVSRMINDFLGITVPILGTISTTRRIRESINQRCPMLLGNHRDENAKVFREMAEALLLEDVAIDDLLIDDDEADQPAAEIAAMPAIVTASEAAPGSGPPGRIEPPREMALTDDTPPAVNPDLEKYTRKHDRHAVDWLASLRSESSLTAVRVHEISAAGVAIECAEPFEIGQRLLLVFDQLPQNPAVNVTVARRIPLGIALEGEIPASVLAAATAALPSVTTARASGARLAG